MTAYKVEQQELPQPVQALPARRVSPRLIPEGVPAASPSMASASPVPPAAPASAQPSTSAEPRMAIPISEYRDLCQALKTSTASQSRLAQEMATLRSQQQQMMATQAQHTFILRQLQQHLGLPSAEEEATPTTTEPHAPHPSAAPASAEPSS